MCVLRAAVLFSADRDHSKDVESRGSGREKEREALRITDTVYVTQRVAVQNSVLGIKFSLSQN